MVLCINGDGTQVVLTKFPTSGGLGTFGLTPSKITHLALPNDLAAWTETALGGCTSLAMISVYGKEVQEGFINLTQNHELYNLSKLVSLHLPSTVQNINFPKAGTLCPIFQKVLKSVYFSNNLKGISYRAFLEIPTLTLVDLSRCKSLKA